MRIDRMLAITVMLLNRDRISARELAERFEVSVRTVYRDIDAINMAGIPVISYPVMRVVSALWKTSGLTASFLL
jgi:predicted DNA-binding transcriptional regulator YafY